MKPRQLFILLVLGIFLLPTCKNNDADGNMDMDMTLEGHMDIIVPPARGPVEFGGFADIDPTAHSDFMEHFDSFEDVQLIGLSAEVLDVSLPDVVINWINFRIHHSADEANWSFTDIPVDPGQVITLDNANGQWDTVKKIIKKKEIFFITVNGESSHGNVHFTLIIQNKIKLTAK